MADFAMIQCEITPATKRRKAKITAAWVGEARLALVNKQAFDVLVLKGYVPLPTSRVLTIGTLQLKIVGEDFGRESFIVEPYEPILTPGQPAVAGSA
ncbi:MAG TPA: hypothetical protein VGA61_16005 [Anaerolineae bacterium]